MSIAQSFRLWPPETSTRASAVMEEHLEAVAERALIVARPERSRDLKDILTRIYGQGNERQRQRQRAPSALAQASMPLRVSRRSALSFHTSICTILPPRTTKRST